MKLLLSLFLSINLFLKEDLQVRAYFKSKKSGINMMFPCPNSNTIASFAMIL